MKSLSCQIIISLLTIIVFSCNLRDEEQITQESKRMSFNLRGYLNITEESSSGRVLNNPDVAITFITVTKGGVDYADGSFFPVVQDESLNLIGDDLYEIKVYSFKKGTGFGIYQSPSSTVNLRSRSYSITNELSTTSLLDFWAPSLEQIRVYTNSDSTSSSLTEAPELDGYTQTFQFQSDTIVDGQSIDILVERRSAGLEVIANNFSEGNLIFELDMYSGQNANNELIVSHPTDSAFFMFVLGTPGPLSREVETKIYHEVNSVKDLVYTGNLTYNANKIKRFEIDVSAANSDQSRISVLFSDKEFVRGDTVSIGGN